MATYPYPKTIGGSLKATYNALDFQDTTLTSTSLNNNYIKTTGGSITGSLNVSGTTTSGSVITNGDTILNGGLRINCQYPSAPFNSYYYSNGLNSNLYGNQFRIYKANGTKTEPSNILKDDLLGSIQGQGYDTVSTWHLKSSSVNFRASENYTSSTTNGGYITFDTNPDSVGGSGVERMRVTQNGDIGIGIITPTYKLHVNGRFYATSVSQASDYRLKTNVMDLSGSYNIDKLRPVEYDMNIDGNCYSKKTGFIAHEVQEHFPHLVTGVKDGESTQSMQYDGFIAILAYNIQEFKRQNEAQQLEINNLKSILNV